MTELLESSAKNAPPTHILVRWLFLRGLGFIYFVAFASFFVQAAGLIGEHGILPAHLFLKDARDSLGAVPFLSCPTLFWFNCSDAAIRLLAGTGIVFSLFVMVGVCTGPLLVFLWLMYLSIVTVGGDFMSFQWDVLLLETGFLSIFFSHYKLVDLPLKKGSPTAEFPEPSPLVLWLMRFLLFKLMLSSGAVKLLSGDITWHDLSALHYHYWTQPLPTPLGWLAAQLPDWYQKFCVAIMFFIELVVPFFIFVPGKLRLIAAFSMILLQVLILVTGNYTFFNWLTILLCLLLLDDALLEKIKLVPLSGLFRSLIARASPRRGGFWDKARSIVLVTLIATLTIGHNLSFAPEPIKFFSYVLSPWYISNGYGLFAVMTTSRKEIIVEASQDGTNWMPYEFIFKPGDVHRAPPWVAPYQPRLDWQMWFAALGTRRDSPWFAHFVFRLLQNSPDVRALLLSEPFNGKPPKFVRASLYDYQFTNLSELAKTGEWWKRTYVGLFFPEASLREPDSSEVVK